MDAVFDIFSKYGLSLAVIAAFCYSVIASLRKVKVIEQNKHFKAWLPLLPSILGGLLGCALPWLFPPNEPLPMRVVVGFIAGSNAATIVAFGRRVVRMAVTKKTDAATATALLAPIDENGSTLPPTGEITKGQAKQVDIFNSENFKK